MRTRHLLAALVALTATAPAQEPQTTTAPARWRAEQRTIDLHTHLGARPEWIDRAVGILDAAGVGIAVNLSGGTTTATGAQPSVFERTRDLFESRYPGRVVQYMSLDYAGWDDDGWSARAVQQVEAGYRLGAAGFKEWKRLGLYLRDGEGDLIAVDDPKLDPVWKRCGELGLPVSIHVSDPKAFWLPYDEDNERWIELKDHPSWWFGDPAKYPSREALLEARNRVVERHPGTTFVCVHFANNPEDIDAVDRWLDRYPNMMVDLAARVPELGRHDPAKMRALFVKHQDRILFGTDFMVFGNLTLGSGGSGPPPTDADGVEFYDKHWRWMETSDRDFEHMTPIQGDWTIDAIDLPDDVLRKVYFDNARQLLARALPAPVLRAARVAEDFAPGSATSAWDGATPAQLDLESMTARARPELSTEVRALWSERFLYLRWVCPFTELTVFEPVSESERMGLWDRDVVELFLGKVEDPPGRYWEFEVAPTGEMLDVAVDLPDKDFGFSGAAEVSVHLDRERRLWTAVLRVPWAALDASPRGGSRWRLNLYRCDRANDAALALRPTLQGSFHVPERFGFLELLD